MNGLLITLEGVEGCGKTTQLKRLVARLQQMGVEPVVSREPGGTALGGELRRLLLASHESGDTWCPESELLLFYADRAQHLARVIRPALEAGRIVILDRFDDSTRAYQGALGVSDLFMERLGELVLGRLRPHMTLLFDLPPEKGLERVMARNGNLGDSFDERRYDDAALEFHQKVRLRFLALAQREQHRVAVIPAEGDPFSVERLVWARLSPLLRSYGLQVEDL